jgi:hypothetical protein
MKVIKGLAFCSVIAIGFGSCFDPPEYPTTPTIEFKKIEYVDAAWDSLFLYIDFKDGDGDLGLKSGDPLYRSAPFNDAFFYQENNGSLKQLTTYSLSTQILDIIDIPDPNLGDLVFPRTKKKALYSDDVPNYIFPYTCTNFNFRTILIEESDAAAIDNLTQRKEFIFEGVKYLEITDTLYFDPNPNHYNIEVRFYVKNGEDYDLYDWRSDGCNRATNVGQTFDARFPFLSEDENTLEGTLKYGMYSLGFKETFGNKTLRLEVRIRDRALHESNVLVTRDFNLLDILKK